jgi:hypothetical protein
MSKISKPQTPSEWENLIRFRESEVWNRKRKSGEYYNHTGYIDEDALLADCIQWMKCAYPELEDFVFHIANEGSSGSIESRLEGARNLTKGVLSGVFDVQSVWAGRMLFCEFKLPGKTYSPRQQVLREKWTKAGIRIDLVDNFDDWRNWIEKVVLNTYKLRL